MKGFILMMILIDPQGNETLKNASTEVYKDRLECMAAKAKHKEDDSTKFYCTKPLLVARHK